MTLTPATVADRVQATGAALWPHLLTPTHLNTLRHTAEHLRTGPAALHFPKSTRVWDLYRHGPTFLDLLTHPPLTTMLTTLLGEHYLLSDYSLNTLHPHQPPDHWHLDHPYTQMPTLTGGPILGVQCVLALDPFTTTNGATRYIPGSHQPPTTPPTDPDPPPTTPPTPTPEPCSSWPPPPGTAQDPTPPTTPAPPSCSASSHAGSAP